ncbi:MAG: polyphosphate polymerase domain-containing protein [Clostridia bacterium]|nr:polyphosphate polymerase domain-containing protein [Clostridia bacterium]
MIFTTIFKRYELKYILTLKQKEQLIKLSGQYVRPDEFGRSTVRNIYFDTENYRLIRNSLERPAYKEKLRVRSYKTSSDDDTVFVELKKKYQSVVYKRRLALPHSQAMYSLCRAGQVDTQTLGGYEDRQIANEINYFMSFYQTLRPTAFITYEREAFFADDRSDLRLTFDENILHRSAEMSLAKEPWGNRILKPGFSLLEIKSSGSMPLWLTRFLTQNNLYKTSFSKYGAAYQDMMLNNNEEVLLYA